MTFRDASLAIARQPGLAVRASVARPVTAALMQNCTVVDNIMNWLPQRATAGCSVCAAQGAALWHDS